MGDGRERIVMAMVEPKNWSIMVMMMSISVKAPEVNTDSTKDKQLCLLVNDNGDDKSKYCSMIRVMIVATDDFQYVLHCLVVNKNDG